MSGRDISTSGPGFQDLVKNKHNETTGRVIAVYYQESVNGAVKVFDVRFHDDRIYYGTPAKNWEKVRANDE